MSEVLAMERSLMLAGDERPTEPVAGRPAQRAPDPSRPARCAVGPRARGVLPARVRRAGAAGPDVGRRAGGPEGGHPAPRVRLRVPRAGADGRSRRGPGAAP